MRMKTRALTCVLPGLLLLSGIASAKPAFVKEYAAYYKGRLPKCTTCHTKPPKLDAYGTALKGALKGGKVLTPAMFKACDATAPKS